MDFQDERDAIDKLLDEDKISMISIINNREYKMLSRLAVRAEIFDDDLLRSIIANKLEMAVSRDGERSNQLIEFAKAIQDEGIAPEEQVDAFNDSGNILSKTKEKVEKK